LQDEFDTLDPKTLSAMRDTIEEILDLLQNSASSGYFGEAVTQLEHALQCADLARRAGADSEMVIAALLHDVGHLLDGDRHEEIGTIAHDDLGAAWLRQRGFSNRVVELVGGHVAAKRYLTAKNPEYAARLSAASVQTLQLQGGPMTPEEAAAFEGDPLFSDKLRLRSWDEQAKTPGAATSALESFRELLLRHTAEGVNRRIPDPAAM
jgi:phosphonate degradation associated HDIG domain protein